MRNAKAMQRECSKKLQFLNNTPQKQQEMQVELMEVEDVTWEHGEPMDTCESDKNPVNIVFDVKGTSLT